MREVELTTVLERHIEIGRRTKLWPLQREFFSSMADRPPREILDLAVHVWKRGDHVSLWAASSLIHNHSGVFDLVSWRFLEMLGESVTSWGAVDAFCSLSGPAWRLGRISDKRILKWARSPNRWWRRMALVSTVFLNRKTCGGYGDTDRTLAVCRVVADDRDDMVVKALSWALRELIPHDRDAVWRFLRDHEDALAARVKREVTNKLTTGLKNPKRQL
jgi:3-methyladenine DNA glycosylase AlkD